MTHEHTQEQENKLTVRFDELQRALARMSDTLTTAERLCNGTLPAYKTDAAREENRRLLEQLAWAEQCILDALTNDKYSADVVKAAFSVLRNYNTKETTNEPASHQA